MVDFSDHHGVAPALLWMGNFRCVQDTDDAFDALALWDDYLIYAVLLEENTQIQKEIMARMKQ